MARISGEKNLEIIPHIASLTRKGITFIIIGLLDSKHILSSLKDLKKKLNVDNRVRILTNVKRDKLNQILLNSKIFLNPSINEHFGISIVEAMSLGCVPLVHDSGGPKEFVKKDLRFNSIEEAAKKVENIIDSWSEKIATNISKTALKFSENNFSKSFINILNSQF